MKLGIMQPYFFPYIGYYQTIKAVDKFLLYGNVSYIKQGWVNRNRIALKDAGEMKIIVPVKNGNSNHLISEIYVNNSTNWIRRMLKCIWHNYSKAAYFNEIYSLIENILCVKHAFLNDLNCHSIIEIARYLDIQTEIVFDNSNYLQLEELLSSKYSGQHDDRNCLDIKHARIIEICKNENNNYYLNAIGGLNLYNPTVFKHHGVELHFIKMDEDIRYAHFSTDFIPGLSIIDVLMHNGKEKTKQLLERYSIL